MKLRKPCEHVDASYPDGHYEHHGGGSALDDSLWVCPGGVFLPDDELIGVLSRCANGEMTFEEFRTWADQWLAEPDKNQMGMW